jgi:predicted XRE-type DNA-binding protein
VDDLRSVERQLQGDVPTRGVADDVGTLDAEVLQQKELGSRGLTQAEAAKILRVTQPRVSDLLRGRIDLFSTDSLIDMLARLGVHVRFVLKASRRRVA